LNYYEEKAMLKSRLISVAFVMALGTAHAHHGWSEYDNAHPTTLSGVIKQAGYEHPHGHIRLEVADKTWLIVLAPPSRMKNRGLPQSALQPGIKATVVAYRNRNKPDEFRAERITIADKTVELR
jgi:hypothetical protein